MRPEASISIAPEPADGADARACLAAYFAELDVRFEDGFDPFAGSSPVPNGEPHAADVFLVARLDRKAVGCGMMRVIAPGVGEIKRMWLAPAVRGQGLSRRLLAELEAHAQAHGLHTLRLDTNRKLNEAQALYRKTGYREIARYNDNPHADHWFEKSLV